MSKFLAGGKLAGGNPERGRVDNDYYATDPKSTRALLDNVQFYGDEFLEPCCGGGHIAEVIKEYYPNANITVIGNNSIKDGSIIQVIVTAEDQSTTIYKIKIEKKQEDNNILLIILISTIIIVIGIVTFALITKNNNKTKEIDANLLNINRK